MTARTRWWALSARILAVGLIACSGGAEPTYVPRDATLRHLPLSFYRAANSAGAPRAFIFFFGNDVGFWRPQRNLAAAMANQGYDVVGFDMKPLLASLPDSAASRDSAFASRIEPLIAATRAEFGADTLPIIIAGHSLGAEVAIWTASHVAIPRLAGVLALSPGSRSHLRVSATDIVNGAEPKDAESFGVADAIAQLPKTARIALVRGENDKYRFADSALVAAGGTRIQRYLVRFAGHSLKRIVVARPVVRRALDWILEPATAAAPKR